MTSSQGWKDYIRAILPWNVYWKLKRIWEEVKIGFGPTDLTSLAKIYQTDKWGHHFYTPVYEQWFAAKRYQCVRLLEIGVGGYARPHYGGDSLRMWKRYFSKGRITGIDIYDKKALEEARIQIFQGDQTEVAFLQQVSQDAGPFDIIIDDGSHIQSHIIASFETLFPLMSSGGIYVIEDTQTSYWPKFEGSTSDMHRVPSAMNYFINRVHQVNQSEWLPEERPVDLPDDEIASIAFYHNLIFVVRK
jgi:demethylmacrocin O-methyltransferase